MRIVAGMATTGNRPVQLQAAIASIESQVDFLYLYDNSRRPDASDNGKFYGLTLEREPCIYFSCDDDIIYPPDYVFKTLEWLDEWDIVTWHARRLRRGATTYYGAHVEMPFHSTQNEGMKVHVAGTGVTAFRTEVFNPGYLAHASQKRVSDLLFSLHAAKSKIPIFMPAHQQNWIKAQAVDSSIMKTEKQGRQILQVSLVNEILSFL